MSKEKEIKNHFTSPLGVGGIQIIPAIDIIDGKCVRLSQGIFLERLSTMSVLWKLQNNLRLPGELASDGTASVNITVVAFDLRFRAGNELLGEQGDIDVAQLRPKLPQYFRALSRERFAQTESFVPSSSAIERLDDDGVVRSSSAGSVFAG